MSDNRESRMVEARYRHKKRMDLRGQPESSVKRYEFDQHRGVGSDGDFTRYQGSMHKVHESSGRHFCWMQSIWVVPQAQFCSCPFLLRGGSFLFARNIYFPAGVCSGDTSVTAQKGAENVQKDSQTHFFDGGSDANPVVQHTCGYEGAA